MENTTQLPAPGSRQLNLKKAFELAVRSLLTACSKEEFLQSFPTFTAEEQESLYKLFIQVITCLPENIEGAFRSLCQETQVGVALDSVEQLVDEQNMDPLFSDKTNLGDTKRDLSTARENEIQFLKAMLESAEEKKNLLTFRVERLKTEKENFSGTLDPVEKFTSQVVNFVEETSIKKPHDAS